MELLWDISLLQYFVNIALIYILFFASYRWGKETGRVEGYNKAKREIQANLIQLEELWRRKN